MLKLHYREVKWKVWGHLSGKWRSWGLSPTCQHKSHHSYSPHYMAYAVGGELLVEKKDIPVIVKIHIWFAQMSADPANCWLLRILFYKDTQTILKISAINWWLSWIINSLAISHIVFISSITNLWDRYDDDVDMMMPVLQMMELKLS